MDLTELRLEMDKIDGELLALFARRMELSEEIARWKMGQEYPILDAVREEEKLQRATRAVPENLRPEARELMRLLMAQSRALQEKIMRSDAT